MRELLSLRHQGGMIKVQNTIPAHIISTLNYHGSYGAVGAQKYTHHVSFFFNVLSRGISLIWKPYLLGLLSYRSRHLATSQHYVTFEQLVMHINDKLCGIIVNRKMFFQGHENQFFFLSVHPVPCTIVHEHICHLTQSFSQLHELFASPFY